jgi:hypothetical protein
MPQPVLAKTKKKIVPTPTPVARINFSKILKLWVYEKSGDVVSDVGGLLDGGKSNKIILKCELKNLTKKEIHGVRGTLRFSSYFGEKICDISLETVLAIAPGQTLGVTWNVGTDRMSKEAFETLKKSPLDKIRQAWYSSAIVFTDGTTLKE